MKPRTVLTILVQIAAVLASSIPDETEQEFVPGKLRDPAAETSFVQGSLRQGTAPTYTEKSCDLTKSAVCASCTVIKVCIAAITITAMVADNTNPKKTCPPATPFCSMSTTVTGAVCQKTPDPAEASCAQAKPAFTCTGIGFYPDPYSCQVYHFCSAQGAPPQDYDCPEGYKFSSKTSGCVAQAGKCPTVTCPSAPAATSIYLPYPDDTQFYVYCTYDTTVTPTKVTPLMFSCGLGSAYNPMTDQCEYKCMKEGNFVDTANPRQYYQCYLMAGKLVYKDKICKADEKFSVPDNACVKA
ncbi:uncharacterized protein LOC6036755 [Culex quinquefasciatus]|uniref:uncharacterized protein LOC6036755 n=1 Tax=Culex quinquefasciatus TaxID=7176 RepID=UPI0018E355A9|nr:uncharacterized protein LOC6036755 [Culex quinquefasciatus]